MPICTQCGENNPDGTSRCIKCGVTIGGQLRARQDAKRSNIASTFTILFRIAMAVVVILLVIPAYKFAGTTYFRYRLNTVKEAAMKSCGGPITESMYPNQKEQINKCMDTDETLIKAQDDYTGFTKGKP